MSNVSTSGALQGADLTFNSARVTALGFLALLVSAGFVIVKLATEGHASFGTTNVVPWGLPVSTYVFFAISSSGLSMVAALSLVFGFESFYPIAKRCVWAALITLVAGFASLGLEIGHPFRMIWTFPTGLQVRSPLFWMGVFYLGDMVLLLLKFWRMQVGDWHSPFSRKLGLASFVAVVLANGTLGSVFGMMFARPFWYDGLLPVYFLFTAALSGVAFAVLFTYASYGFSRDRMPADVRDLLTGPLPKVFATAIGVVGIYVVARTLNGLWGNAEGLEVFKHTVKTLGFNAEVWLCLAVPFLLMLSRNREGSGQQRLAALLVIVGQFVGRYDFTIGGQIVPLFKGQWVTGFAGYSPSLTEYMIVVVAISLMVFLYAAGEWLFGLSDTPAGHKHP